ncbi:MAG: RibD family protein [Bacteriovoracaceae bacterium]
MTSINEEIGSRFNEIFFTHIKFNRPFIHLKWAQSLDGYIGNGTKNYLSCEESLKLVHEMRLATDAVMIGRNTLNTDNPKLTTRLQNFERASKRIVLGKFSLMNKAANLFQDEFKTQTIVVTNEQLPECDNVISLNEENYQLETIVKALYKKGITSILVEGGEKLLTGFIEQKLVDRVSIFITPMLLQNGINAIHSLVTPALPFKFTNHEWLQVGRDMLFDSRISNLK